MAIRDTSKKPRVPGTLAAAALAALALAPAACRAIQPPPPEELDLWHDSSAGVDDQGLALLCERYWESWLAAHPVQATLLGDPRYHGELPQESENWKLARRGQLEDQARRARSLVDARLSARDRITLEMLVLEIEKELTRLDLDLGSWTVDPLEGPHLRLLDLCRYQPMGTARERAQLVERWGKAGNWIRQAARDLERGKAQGRVASRHAIQKAIAQLDELLRQHPMDTPLVRIAGGGGEWVEVAAADVDGAVSAIAHERLGDSRHQRLLRTVNQHLQDGPRQVVNTRVLIPRPDDPLPPEERGEFLYAVLTAVEHDLFPALQQYRDLLERGILPAARGDDRPGISHLEGGEEAYRLLIREHLSLPLEDCDPRAIHEFGLAEVARIQGEIADLGERVFGTRDVTLIQERLRNDPGMHFATREEVQKKAAEALHRANARVPQYFGTLPEAECVVVAVPAHAERDTTIAYYQPPSLDGERPGQYFVNTYQPETRPRYEAEVLAYHESVPGHHLQIALAHELRDVPLFRRHAGSTAFVEGWALYTERLCDEMGLYSSDLDRMGILSFDAWRACRLVVDTGLHAFGWSRSKAIDYLYANTLLARNNVENEVDRYIAWPGQALAYKIGQREILELRAEAQEALGTRFHYPEFHDVVLENGAVPLSTLQGVVHRWLERRTAPAEDVPLATPDATPGG